MALTRAIWALVIVSLLGFALAQRAEADPAHPRVLPAPIDSATGVDHDGQPVDRPAKHNENFYANVMRAAVVEPMAHAFDVPDKVLWILQRFGIETKYESADINAFDEVPNSTWFTNRNHFHSLALDSVRLGPFGAKRPSPPLAITARKEGGTTPGFQIRDADGQKWLVKLDPPGFPQAASGADVVSGRLLYAAGYNISHDEAVSFHREDLTIDPELARGKKGEKPFQEAELDSLLAHGAKSPDGRYYAEASLFLPGKPVGIIDTRNRREDDPNDRFHHARRRELRGLFVLDSWLGNWDETDLQSLDMFEETSGHKGHVEHNLLDASSSLGAARLGAKPLPYGYEYGVDYGWMARRFLTLGFVNEPWRKARQATGIPSVGNFESDVYEPDKFHTLRLYEPFRERTLRDEYWGAKLVASFSDAQIGAAIDAAGYEDPRAREFLRAILIRRRDKVVRYWFGRVVPVDFFHIDGGALLFHDLAVDRGLESPRGYAIRVVPLAGRVPRRQIRLTDTSLELSDLGSTATRVRLLFNLDHRHAKPTTVELVRQGSGWAIAAVRHA